MTRTDTALRDEHQINYNDLRYRAVNIRDGYAMRIREINARPIRKPEDVDANDAERTAMNHARERELAELLERYIDIPLLNGPRVRDLEASSW